MVAKTDGSLNSLGRTMVVLDKPTRAALKAKAAAAGLPLSQYLRKIAFDGKGAMLSVGSADVSQLEDDANELIESVEANSTIKKMWLGAVKRNAAQGNKLLLSKLVEQLSELYVKQELVVSAKEDIELKRLQGELHLETA